MLKSVSKGLVVVAGLLAVPGSSDPNLQVLENPYQSDPRLTRLQQFFQQKGSPAHAMAEDFLVASDKHNLDWRLLPSISFLESGGGKEYRNNNILGWDSCRQNFPTIRDGIHAVASRLANSKLYKDKDLDAILATYNPYNDYASKVKMIMRALGPETFPPEATLN